ncbi:MAG: trypsin-like peptidase domain-containing protein [Candidatus Moraniibacteriota bacterium]
MENIEINPQQEEAKIQSKDTHKKNKYSKHPVFYFISLILFVILLSSTFGAIFGFMAGGFGNKLVDRISQEFPGIFKKNANQYESIIDPTISREKIIQEDSAVIDVVDKASPAVVSIIISKDITKLQNNFFDPFGFFGDGNNSSGQNNSGITQKEKIGGGTGFLVTTDGMIVTNKHVVSDTTADYTVMTNDDKEYEAKVLARDPVNDIAVIKIEGSDFPVLNFGDSNSLKIGQTVIAIGNSLGEFSNTVSKGIVSGLKRNLTAGGRLGDSEKLNNIIQTDAAINPGNSGGPLLDISGNVIGVNVAMAQGAQNVGFAIPVAQITKVVNQVKTTGKISTPYLGVRYVPIDVDLQKEINLDFDYGVLIARGERVTDFAVVPGSPADKAGLMENDVILEINGTKINDKNSLTDLISNSNVGDKITLKVWHKGNTKEVEVKLEERKN